MLNILKKHNKGFYAWLNPTPRTNAQLSLIGDIFDRKGVHFMFATNYHVTVAHHEGRVPNVTLPNLSGLIKAKALGFELFNKSIVLELRSSVLQDIVSHLQSQGLVYPYSPYRPHITIGEVESPSVTNTLLKELNLINMEELVVDLLPVFNYSNLG